jgi:hypothetical protein
MVHNTIQVSATPKFVPSHVGGDRDFGGHGPQVNVSATISVQNQEAGTRTGVVVHFNPIVFREA